MWINVKDKPIPENTNVMAAVEMCNGSVEYHLIYIDPEDGSIVDGEGEPHDCWSVWDYTYWMSIPPIPEED